MVARGGLERSLGRLRRPPSKPVAERHRFRLVEGRKVLIIGENLPLPDGVSIVIHGGLGKSFRSAQVVKEPALRLLVSVGDFVLMVGIAHNRANGHLHLE